MGNLLIRILKKLTSKRFGIDLSGMLDAKWVIYLRQVTKIHLINLMQHELDEAIKANSFCINIHKKISYKTIRTLILWIIIVSCCCVADKTHEWTNNEWHKHKSNIFAVVSCDEALACHSGVTERQRACQTSKICTMNSHYSHIQSVIQ